MSKVNKRKFKLYTNQALTNAVTGVKAGMSLGSACRAFNVPKSTIYARLTSNRSVNGKPGPQSTLPPPIESYLVKWIISSNERGFSVTKVQLLNSVRMLVKNLEIKNNFNEHGPGRNWYKNFMNRHPHARALINQKHSNQISPTSLKTWYKNTELYLKKNNLLDIEPQRIFTASEILLLLNPETHKSSSMKDKRHGQNDTNIEDINVLLTGNADGQFMPPLMIYPDQNLPPNVIINLPNGWSFNQSYNGDLTDKIFCDFVNNSFHAWLVQNEIRFPVILYVDGRAPYLTYSLFNSCAKKKIEIIPLHPNSEQLLQPIDVSIDDPLQAEWEIQVDDYRERRNLLTVNVADAATLLMKSMQELNLTNMMKHGFHNCGLHPFSADVIDYLKIKSNKKKAIAEESNEKEFSTRSNYTLALQCIEERIDEDTLAAFQAAASSNSWSGAIEHASLFYVWHDLKKSISNCTDFRIFIKEECIITDTDIKQEPVDDSSDLDIVDENLLEASV